MLTEFIFVRHGETDANRAGILQGSRDIPLNAVGIRQAEAVAEYLRDTDFDAVYSSPLSRAVKTAEVLLAAGHDKLLLQKTPALQEWRCGELDGLTWEEINARFPKEAGSFCFEQIEVQMPGGESGFEFQKRVEDFLQHLRDEFPGKRILLVSHGGVLQRIFRFVAGVVAEGNIIPLAGNASVSSFVFNHKLNAWQLTSWNHLEHLKGLPQHVSRVL